MVHRRLQATTARESNSVHSGVVGEPAHLLTTTLVHQGRGKTASLLRVEDGLHDILLAGTGRHEGNVVGGGNHGQGESDTLRRGLGRVGFGGHPGVFLA